jgi:hypothetical protein
LTSIATLDIHTEGGEMPIPLQSLFATTLTTLMDCLATGRPEGIGPA